MRAYLWSTAFLLGIAFSSNVIAEEKTVPLEKLPQAVTEAVKKMFPKAEMLQASEDEEDGHIEYEVTVKESGKRIDITVEADGDIEGLEKEFDLKDLPKLVIAALDKKFPKAAHKSAEAVFQVNDGKERLEYYEVQLTTADNKKIEAMVKTDGTVIEQETDEDD